MIDDIVRRKGYLSLGSRLRRIGERLQAETHSVIVAHGLPLQGNHYPLMAALDEFGPLTIGDLASALGISQPGVTRMVGQLVSLGVVSAKPGESDQRQKIVSLSAKGLELVDVGRREIWPLIHRCVAEMLEGREGSLLQQLDHLEEELRQRPFLDRIGNKNRGGSHG